MKKYYSLLLVLVLMFALSQTVFAAVFGTTIPEGDPITLTTLKLLVRDIVNWLYRIGLLVAVGYIIFAGIKWISAGSDSAKVDEAKAMLKAAIIGFAIVVGVGVIVATIDEIVATGTI